MPEPTDNAHNPATENTQDDEAEQRPVGKTQVIGPQCLLDGKYKLGKMLGEGGMGAVYEAEHVGLNIRVAVKILSEIFKTDPHARSRFRIEARAAASIRHPNVVAVTDTGTDDDGIPYLVMELLEGESLSQFLRREKTLSVEESVEITCQILSGLAAAHAQKVIHRDLKPGNIFVASERNGARHVKILDFGISKIVSGEQGLTAIGAVVGTPRFMAPEQALGWSDIDVRVDIYAVGVLLYRMLAGKLPFDANSHEKLIQQILSGTIPSLRDEAPHVPAAVEQVVYKAMAKDRALRYSSADHFIAALNRAFAESQSTAIAPPASESFQDPNPTDVEEISTQLEQNDPHEGPTAVDALTTRSSTFQRALWIGAFALIVAGGLGIVAYYAWFNPKNVVLSGPPIRFGITEYLPRATLEHEQARFLAYLRQEFKRPVSLEILKGYVDLAERLERGSLDFAALSPYAYIRAKRRFPGLTLLASHETSGGRDYEGIVVTRTNTKMNTLADLKGKTFCYVNPSSTSGYIYPRAMFRKIGIDPDNAFKTTVIAGDHLSALRWLDSGICDGAAVFSGLLYEGEQHGLPPKNFKILASTDRIPYDAYCASPKLSADEVSKLQQVLLKLSANSDLGRAVFPQENCQTGSPSSTRPHTSDKRPFCSRISGMVPVRDTEYDPVRAIERYVDEADFHPLHGQ